MVVTTKYAGVTITRGAEWQDNLTSATPDQWPEIIAEYQWYCRHVLPGDCRNLLHMVREGEATGWAGYDDRETYLREGLGLDPEAVDWALRGLKIVAVDKPVALKEAQKLGRHGGARPIRDDIEQGDNGTLEDANTKRGSNAAVYLTARLKRDAPAIAARLAAGEFRSARAAAIEAGIVKPESLLATVRRAWKRMTPSDRETFLREIAS
jgi:hypothetical protein